MFAVAFFTFERICITRTSDHLSGPNHHSASMTHSAALQFTVTLFSLSDSIFLEILLPRGHHGARCPVSCSRCDMVLHILYVFRQLMQVKVKGALACYDNKIN